MSLSDVITPNKGYKNVLNNQGWISLIDSMGDDLAIINSAKVSFGRQQSEFNPVNDVPFIFKLLENAHGTPFEHVVVKFAIYCPLFTRGQWHRSRTWSYMEVSRRYCKADIEFYTPDLLTSRNGKEICKNPQLHMDEMKEAALLAIDTYNRMLEDGVPAEIARGILPQNMMVLFYGTVNVRNLIKFLILRRSPHAQYEIRQYANAILELIQPVVPTVYAALISNAKIGVPI